MDSLESIVLFSGAGGVSEGLRQLGINSTGLEIWNDANDTARANGHKSLQIDVAAISPSVFTEGLSPFLLQASPPCQGLSVAGKKTGRKDIDNIRLALEGHDVKYESQYSHLITNIKNWIDLRPHVVMLEQVTSIGPIWDWYEEYLSNLGYDVWNQTVYMEQYGLPQTRKRSILIACSGVLNTPPILNTKFSAWHVEKYTGKSMEDVLPQWAGKEIGFPRLYDGRGQSILIGDTLYRARDLRHSSLPAFSMTEKARSWRVGDRPAGIDEVKLLQGFPPEYKFAGTRTSKYLQLGNALPPSIVKYLLSNALSLPN